MKVKELHRILSVLVTDHGDEEVILQKDAEGNGFSPLAGYDENCRYAPRTTWAGTVGLDYLTPELRKQGYTEADIGKGRRVIVLYPVN